MAMPLPATTTVLQHAAIAADQVGQPWRRRFHQQTKTEQ
jgi:hypothetical protein